MPIHSKDNQQFWRGISELDITNKLMMIGFLISLISTK